MSSVVTRTDAQRNSQSLPPRAVGSDIRDAIVLASRFTPMWDILSPRSAAAQGFVAPYLFCPRPRVPVPLHSSAAAHSHCGGIAKRLIGCACSAADIKLARPGVLAFLLVLFGVNLLFGAQLDQHGWGREAIAWQAHIGGFLAGRLAFAAFNPIPIATGGGPNEGMDAPPPAINLDTIAGCALLA